MNGVTNVTARFSKQILAAMKNPDPYILYYIFDSGASPPSIEKFVYFLGDNIVADGIYCDEELDENLPRFPVEIRIEPRPLEFITA